MSDDNASRRGDAHPPAPRQSGIMRRPRRVSRDVPGPPASDAAPTPSAGGDFWASKSGFGDASPIVADETLPSAPMARGTQRTGTQRAVPTADALADGPAHPATDARSEAPPSGYDHTVVGTRSATHSSPGAPSPGAPSPRVASHSASPHPGSSSAAAPRAASDSATRSGVGQRDEVGPGAAATVPAQNPAASSGRGLQLPGYRILKVLGKGGMGEVCLAERISSAGVPVKCVVKTILPHATRNHQYRDLFLDEARLVSYLRHPNVVTVMECGQQGDVLFQAMEWIEGLDAGELMERANAQGGGIPLRHLLYLLREVLQGLHYAHTAVDHEGQPLHIVHRDISPGNILISRQGAVKLADFGVAVGTASHTEGARESLAGKPHYFAPELWKGASASPSTDVFALAVSFYELLSGRPLFDRSASLRALAWEICHFTPDALLERDLTIPEGLESIVRRSLAAEPADRYASALEFLEDVNDYAYEYGIRLLDAHFARYVERVLGGGEGRRRHLFAGGDDTP